MKKLLYVFLFSLILGSLLLTESTFAYENAEYNFTINTPSMWEIDEDTGIELVLVTFIEPDSRASINIVIEETRGTLLDYIEGSKVGLAGSFDDYVLVYEGSRVIGGLDCYEIVSTWTESDTLELKMKQIIFVEDGIGYVLTCGSLESDYSTYLVDFENSVTSFRITSDSATSPLNLDSLIIIGFVIIAIIVLLLVLFMFRRTKNVQSSIQQPDSGYSSPEIADVKVNVGSSPKFCRHCGAETKIDTVFCDNCGKRLKN